MRFTGAQHVSIVPCVRASDASGRPAGRGGTERLTDRAIETPTSASQSLEPSSGGATKPVSFPGGEQVQYFAARDPVATHDADDNWIVEHVEERQFAIDQRRLRSQFAGLKEQRVHREPRLDSRNGVRN